MRSLNRQPMPRCDRTRPPPCPFSPPWRPPQSAGSYGLVRWSSFVWSMAATAPEAASRLYRSVSFATHGRCMLRDWPASLGASTPPSSRTSPSHASGASCVHHPPPAPSRARRRPLMVLSGHTAWQMRRRRSCADSAWSWRPASAPPCSPRCSYPTVVMPSLAVPRRCAAGGLAGAHAPGLIHTRLIHTRLIHRGSYTEAHTPRLIHRGSYTRGSYTRGSYTEAHTHEAHTHEAHTHEAHTHEAHTHEAHTPRSLADRPRLPPPRAPFIMRSCPLPLSCAAALAMRSCPRLPLTQRLSDRPVAHPPRVSSSTTSTARTAEPPSCAARPCSR